MSLILKIQIETIFQALLILKNLFRDERDHDKNLRNDATGGGCEMNGLQQTLLLLPILLGSRYDVSRVEWPHSNIVVPADT